MKTLFNDFDLSRYDVITLDNVQSFLQIDEVINKYSARLKAYRYNVLEGRAEFLLSKQ